MDLSTNQGILKESIDVVKTRNVLLTGYAQRVVGAEADSSLAPKLVSPRVSEQTNFSRK